MRVEQNFPLRDYNTFGLDITTHYFVQVESVSDLEKFHASPLQKIQPRIILGGGSNLVFRSDYKGLAIHSAIKSIDVIEDTDEHVMVKAGSGLEWDSFVEHCVSNNWGGIENLSDIPGCIGAAPVQNIGAYGVEAKDHITEVHCFELRTGRFKIFTNTECLFGYRDSIFKKDGFQNYFVSHVCFRFSKKHKIIGEYGRVHDELKKFDSVDIKLVRKVITDIRRSKLPTTDELGSAGSFFKNPVVSADYFAELSSKYPDIPHYKINGTNRVKIPAAWLIEKSGLKGYRNGQVGTFVKQPLVIVNYGGASGEDIVALADLIQKKVAKNFGIRLEPEACYV